MRNFLYALLVFGLTAGEEFIAIRRMRAVIGRSPRQAALWCAIYAAVLLLALAPVMAAHELAPFYVAGAAVGGWVAVKYRR